MISAVTVLAFADEDQATVGFAGLGVGVGVGAAGVTLTASDAAPAPTPLIARSLIWWAVPLVRPVILIGELTEAGLREVHVEPLSVEYS